MPKLYVSNKDESLRLFKNEILEKFTHVHWTVPMILFLPAIFFFMYHSVDRGLLSQDKVFASFISGIFIWTLTEYLLHRFIFHYEPKTLWGKYLHFLFHGIHHDYPNDATRLVMPPSVSIPLSTLFYFMFKFIFGDVYVWPIFSGFIFGYVCYDTIHYAVHHLPMKGTVALWVKHHHIRHHYLDNGRGFGVSSPLWDYVFNTMYAEEDKKIETEQTE
jgi:4-hydroxysphinganine ceramide fatty acyl 2-hydroxylase